MIHPQACQGFFRTAPMGRREFLRAGSLSLMGLGLPQLVQARQASISSNIKVRLPRKPAKACILLFMWGGPAQQDTWDPKPMAPAEYRGEFKPIRTSVPGIQICEHLPRLAQRMDKLAVIRSMTHGDVNHTTATHELLTGYPLPKQGATLHEDWPNIGSVLSRMGKGKKPLPAFVSMMPKVAGEGAPRFVEESHGQGAGWLGPVYQPMRIDSDASSPNYKVADFNLRADIPPERFERRRSLLQQIDHQVRELEQDQQLSSMSRHYENALSILTRPEVTAAFDLSKEDPKLRERYGMNIHGQAVLQARRLVEAGVPLVTVFWQNDGITNVSVYWDTHSRNFIDLKTRLCPVTDQAFSALLDDLEQRGMLDDVLVVWTGEMGRTPRVGQSVVGGAGAGRDGRDHWSQVFSSVLAGGGIQGGIVHGSSDKFAAAPASNPTSPADLVATIYHCLGIDPETLIMDRLQRPQSLTNGKVIEAILSA
ncbi:MAG: DUF1501 domain-containing protein [Planctomycetia bacterium]|nr:DUF1501 domain-containing protein [Planctomycetia bacterium]